MSKYEPAKFPATKEEAFRLAEERDGWAKAARHLDRPGSAKEFELSALLLRFYAFNMPDEKGPAETTDNVIDALASDIKGVLAEFEGQPNTPEVRAQMVDRLTKVRP